MMPPAGPDGKQGGRGKAEADAPRDRGEASDKVSEASGEAPKTEAKAKPKARAATADASSAEAGRKPETLTAARDGGADDLKMIKGVGPKLEKLLNSMGFFHFDQIAKWGKDELAWVDQNLEGFKGRASRDAWVDQAGRLARGEATDFSAKASKDGRYD